MKSIISKIFDNLSERKRFVNYRAVLFTDTVLSVAGTCITLLFVNSFITNIEKDVIITISVCSGIISFLIFHFLRVSRNIIRHASIKSVGKIETAILLKELSLLIVAILTGSWLPEKYLYVCCFIDLLTTTGILVGARVVLILIYDIAVLQFTSRKARVLVYGTGDKSVALKKRMYTSKHFHVVGFVNPDKNLKSYSLSESPVYYFADESNFVCFVEKYNINGIIFPSYEEAQKEQGHLVKFCQDNNVKNYVSPPIDVLGDGLKKTVIREIRIEDLLGRDEIEINMLEIIKNFTGKTILVTGAAGSIGSELCRQLATFGIKQLVLFDNAETPMHELRLELERFFPELTFVPFIGDVRQKERLQMAFERFRPQVVFHAAAYKHVPLMEENPCEAVRVNVVGSRLVADFCVQYCVEKMVMISTDKAVKNFPYGSQSNQCDGSFQTSG